MKKQIADLPFQILSEGESSEGSGYTLRLIHRSPTEEECGKYADGYAVRIYPYTERTHILFVRKGQEMMLYLPECIKDHFNPLRYLPLAQILAEHGRVILHASAVKYHGEAILFSAPSGTGKTTQANLLCGMAQAEILSEDKTILGMKGGRVCAWKAPLSPEESSGEAVPVSLICMIHQGREVRIRFMEPEDAFCALLAETVRADAERPLMDRICGILGEILENVRIADVLCTRDTRTAEEILRCE